MDFEDSPEAAEFRHRASTWLTAYAPAIWDNFARTPENELAVARRWQAAKAAAGFAGLTWPVEYGGAGLPALFDLIWHQEEAAFDVPANPFDIGLNICLRTLMHYAPPAALERRLPPALRGDEIWCQLFSEPAGGSDLAALRTRAVRKDDAWHVTGQKVWTSGAHYSDFGIIITRTDFTVPKHAGLTMFWLDLRSPGIAIHPLRQADGGAEFSEVFLNEVEVPDSQRLGPVGGGWGAVITTLMFERMSIASGYPFPDVAAVFELAKLRGFGPGPRVTDGRVRERLADWWINSEGLRLNNCRAITELSRGETPGPGFSIAKLVGARQAQQIAYFLMDLQGPEAMLADSPSDASMSPLRAWMWSAAARIAGGTDEIVANIIAERVLGLPPEMRVDKAVPFDSLSICPSGE